MDAAERWLRANDPQYKQIKAKELRKKKQKAEYIKSMRSAPHRGKQHATRLNGKKI